MLGKAEETPPLLPLALFQALLCGIALGTISWVLAATFCFQNSASKQGAALSFHQVEVWLNYVLLLVPSNNLGSSEPLAFLLRYLERNDSLCQTIISL